MWRPGCLRTRAAWRCRTSFMSTGSAGGLCFRGRSAWHDQGRGRGHVRRRGMRTGGCMCGAVRFEAETDDRFSVCFCKMCQRWSSGVYMGAPTTLAFDTPQGEDVLRHRENHQPGPVGDFAASAGRTSFTRPMRQSHPKAWPSAASDDTSGMTPRIQFFIDKKPEGFALDIDTKTMTEAECMAHFAPGDFGRRRHDQV